MVTLENNKYVSAFAETRIGGRGENQDNYGFATTRFGFLMTVCDGMGGGPGGRTASSIAVKEIIEGIKEADTENTIANNLIRAVRRANKAILDRAKEEPELQGMGSTCTALILTDKNAIIAHVGDSRVYQFRGSKKLFRTFDHSMVFELVKNKVLTEEQARLSAQSNVITRALGIQDDVEVELNIVPYKKGDRFMLCSDGIHGSMPEDKLIRLVTSKSIVLGKLIDQVATEVDEIGLKKGGQHDNLTLILADALIDSEDKAPVPQGARYSLLSLLAISIIVGISSFSMAIKSCQHNRGLKEPPILEDTANVRIEDTAQITSDTTVVKSSPNDSFAIPQDSVPSTNQNNNETE